MLDKEKTISELEAELKLKEKIKEAKVNEEHWDNSFYGAIIASVVFAGFTIFFFVKKPDEHWLKLVWIFGGGSALMLVMAIFMYNWYKDANKKVKELKKQEKELVNSTKW